MLQGGGALAAYEVGAVEYLYERHGVRDRDRGIGGGDERGGADRGYAVPATVLRKLWAKLAVDSPIAFLPEISVPLPQ